MCRVAIAVFAISLAATGYAQNETVNSQLIISCYNLDLKNVILAFRDGADANARLGPNYFGDRSFVNRWNGSKQAITNYTPLIALACSPIESPPDVAFGDVWKDPLLVEKARLAIPANDRELRREREIQILYILLSNNCRLNLDEGRGWTALAFAVNEDKFEFARILLEWGANPNSKGAAFIDGPSQITPLHLARNVEMAKILVKYGADVLALDSEGKTPADWNRTRFEFKNEAGRIEVIGK